jgi:hypothetical protein
VTGLVIVAPLWGEVIVIFLSMGVAVSVARGAAVGDDSGVVDNWGIANGLAVDFPVAVGSWVAVNDGVRLLVGVAADMGVIAVATRVDFACAVVAGDVVTCWLAVVGVPQLASIQAATISVHTRMKCIDALPVSGLPALVDAVSFCTQIKELRKRVSIKPIYGQLVWQKSRCCVSD